MALSEVGARLATAVQDRYRVVRELGGGGMAHVFLAEDERHRRMVAVKVLRPELSMSLATDRFLREIQIAARLLHPHILTLIDSGEAAADRKGGWRLLYYVMPFVDGESLRARLEREGELPLEDGVRILREVADAIAYAHAHGVVHRDIKPENVLLAGRHALVTDFGIAKAIALAADDRELTGSGMAVGTPAYMAPEQAAGEPSADHRVDIYALGVLGYELLGGAPPFTGASPQVVAAHLTRVPEPVSRLRPGMSTALEQIVMRCLEKRPADRWQTADELLRRLDDVGSANASTPAETQAARVLDIRTFRLSEDVCRTLNRATLDPRIIGGEVYYLDNNVESDVLVCYLPGVGQDHRVFERALRESPYRGLALTPYGFEPEARRRIAVSWDDHVRILRALVADAIARLRPRMTILVGFSLGADIALAIMADAADYPPVDGIITCGCNVSLETCYVTSRFARIEGSDVSSILSELQEAIGNIRSLDEWLHLHEYLVWIFRKFRNDIGPLRRPSADYVRLFEENGTSQFTDSYRKASARVRRLRCVFEDTEPYNKVIRELKLQNLDEPVLGDHYRHDSFVTEPTNDHFELVQPERVARHVEGMVAELEALTRSANR